MGEKLTETLAPFLYQQIFVQNGTAPAVGYKIFTYVAGSSTKQATWTDSTGGVQNGNPIVLDSSGTANVWLDPTLVYKFVISPPNDTDPPTSPIRTVDNVYPSLNASNISVILSTAILAPFLGLSQTAVEASIGVIPTNLSIPPYPMDPRRYGGVGNQIADDTVAVQTAFNVAAKAGGMVKIQPGFNFLCTANINVQVATVGFGGAPFSPDLEGSGWTNWGLTFSGAAVTTGLTYTGNLPTNPSWTGSIRNIAIQGVSGALQGVTYLGCTKPLIFQSLIYGFAGRGIYYSNCIMPTLEKSLLANCGTASLGIVEVDNTTVFRWDQSYISGGSLTCFAGLVVDRTQTVLIQGGAIESCGSPILISCKISSNIPCTGVTIKAIDLENPGNGNRYIDVGSALTGGAVVGALVLDAWTGSPDAPTTTQPSGVRLQNTAGAHCRVANFSVAGTPGASYEIAGTGNLGVHIDPHRNLYGNSYPWVTVNGTQVKAASPQYDWVQGNSPRGLSGVITNSSISGATPSILFSASQGGYYSDIILANGGATTITQLLNGEAGMQIILVGDGNSTLTNGTGAGQFATLGGANLLAASNKSYAFISNGTCWIQH